MGEPLELFLTGAEGGKIWLFLPAAWLLGKRVWCRSAWEPWSSRPEATCLSEEKGPETRFARTPPPRHAPPVVGEKLVRNELPPCRYLSSRRGPTVGVAPGRREMPAPPSPLLCGGKKRATPLSTRGRQGSATRKRTRQPIRRRHAGRACDVAGGTDVSPYWTRGPAGLPPTWRRRLRSRRWKTAWEPASHAHAHCQAAPTPRILCPSKVSRERRLRAGTYRGSHFLSWR